MRVPHDHTHLGESTVVSGENRSIDRDPSSELAIPRGPMLSDRHQPAGPLPVPEQMRTFVFSSILRRGALQVPDNARHHAQVRKSVG
jgi:hypothetical protein